MALWTRRYPGRTETVLGEAQHGPIGRKLPGRRGNLETYERLFGWSAPEPLLREGAAARIARHTASVYVQISAVTSNVAEVRKLIDDARHQLTHFDRRTVVFLDEIHRFNKAQQDVLLPAVEDGTLIPGGSPI